MNNFYDDIFASSSVDLNKKILEAKLFGWGASIAQSVIGSILGAVAVGVLVIILLYSQCGLGWILQDTIKNLHVFIAKSRKHKIKRPRLRPFFMLYSIS